MLEFIGYAFMFLCMVNILICGPVLLSSIYEYCCENQNEEKNKDLKSLIICTTIIIIIGICIFKIGDVIIDYGRKCDYEVMETKSALIEDVYVEKISYDKYGIGFANLIKDDYCQTFKLWYDFDKGTGEIKKGDRIDIRFDPKTNTVLKIVNVYHEEKIEYNPFVTKSF